MSVLFKKLRGAWGHCVSCRLVAPLVDCTFCPQPVCERCFGAHVKMHREQARLAGEAIKAQHAQGGLVH